MIKDGKLYGRGGADDGYAMFASLAALLALKDQNIAHGRVVILIEASEESGSPDLPFYVDHLSARIGTPDLVVCLDSGCGNYEQLWLTTSLRGNLIGNLTVKVLTEGVHSGAASGIVPSSFRIARQLLSRIEDEDTGAMTLQPLFVDIPPERIEQARAAAKILGDNLGRNAVRWRYPADGRRQCRTDPEPQLAAATGDHRHGRLSPAGKWRQCAFALFHGEIIAAPAAQLRW